MIRLAKEEDMPEMLRVYEAARQYMVASGNPHQWLGGYPTREMLENDLKIGNRLYVVEREWIIRGAFAFMLGEDPTYGYIEDGKWLNDLPYGTIHRIGSDGKTHGVFEEALEFCKGIVKNIRIDTHRDNLTMQHLILKHAFTRCGIVYMEDGSARIAYQALF